MLQAPRGSMRRPGSEFARETGAEPVTEKAPRAIWKADASPLHESECRLLVWGTRCWSGGGREALAWPKQVRGCSKPQLPPGCVGVNETKVSRQGSHQSLAFREDEGDGRESGESCGNDHHSPANERTFR
jgi:hypothetical protein